MLSAERTLAIHTDTHLMTGTQCWKCSVTKGNLTPIASVDLTNGGDKRGVESVISISEQHARFPHSRVANQKQLEQQVVGFLWNCLSCHEDLDCIHSRRQSNRLTAVNLKLSVATSAVWPHPLEVL